MRLLDGIKVNPPPPEILVVEFLHVGEVLAVFA
jgi:hypothetical protein